MGGSVREVAATYVLLGQAAAYFALYAIALDPATFHHLQLQLAKEPDQSQTACAPTAAETLKMRGDAMVLLLFAVAQAVTAMAAVAATSRLLTVCAQILSIPVGMRLLDVLPGVVDLAIGRCHGWYHQAVVAGCTIISVTFTLLFLTGLVINLCVCGKNTGKDSSRCDCDCGTAAAVAIDIESREMKDGASSPRQGAVTPSKPSPAPSGGATTGSPSRKERKINHGAASTSQAPPPRPLLASPPQGHTAFARLQHGMPPSPGSTQQQHLQYQLQRPAYMFQFQYTALLQPQQDVHGHGLDHTALMGALQNLSLSLQDSGTAWVAFSGPTYLTSDQSRFTTQGGAAPMQQSLQLPEFTSGVNDD